MKLLSFSDIPQNADNSTDELEARVTILDNDMINVEDAVDDLETHIDQQNDRINNIEDDVVNSNNIFGIFLSYLITLDILGDDPPTVGVFLEPITTRVHRCLNPLPFKNVVMVAIL